eukprot:CAMPEP_0115054596 /NCGR_PEP_ID=MMETSP0227-20121206/4177_1 /TAXON_ID=89957 /ORGANISM="Polarella glacialis, Strain CCMP 1383" /LENGTH=89 /DNA_ID=CAMNT_0002439079 /DNA_START=1316 /DNA_END=1586 /DNA_ORIENTATION=+
MSCKEDPAPGRSIALVAVAADEEDDEDGRVGPEPKLGAPGRALPARSSKPPDPFSQGKFLAETQEASGLAGWLVGLLARRAWQTFCFGF